MSEVADNYFFDDPGYWHSSGVDIPEYIQGFINIRPEVAAIDGILAARIQTHSESDDAQKDAEGEQL